MSTRSEAAPSFSAPGESRDLLPALRDLFSERPEYRHHEPWELAHVLYSLGYVEDFPPEAEITLAAEVTRADRLRAFDQLLLRRFQGKVGRGLALDLSRRPTEEPKGAA